MTINDLFEALDEAYDMGYADAEASAAGRWQLVTADPRGAGHTYRLRVPGGWLYRTVTYRYPEQHALFEKSGSSDPVFSLKDYAPGGRVDRWHEAQEIVAQTTTFIPEE